MSSKRNLNSEEDRGELALAVEVFAAAGMTFEHQVRDVGSRGPPPVDEGGVAVGGAMRELPEGTRRDRTHAVASRVPGDGKTTETALDQVLLLEATKLVAAGMDPIQLKRGIDAAVAVIVDALASQSKSIDTHFEIAKIATISAGDDEQLGTIIADAMQQVGRDGVVTTEESQTVGTTLALASGIQFGRGYLSPGFVTDPVRMAAVLRDPLILLSDQRLSSTQDLVPLLDASAAAGRPLLVIAQDVAEGALASFVANNRRHRLQVCAVKAPGLGQRRPEVLEDLAILFGTRVFGGDLAGRLKSLSVGELGGARSATIHKHTTTLVEPRGAPQAIQGRVMQLRRELEHCATQHGRDELHKRITDIAGRVAVIRIGAATEVDQQEKTARVEDALHATRAAMTEGIVPGGGVGLLRALAALKTLKLRGEQNEGVTVVRRAIEQRLRRFSQGTGSAPTSATIQGEAGAQGRHCTTGDGVDPPWVGMAEPTRAVRLTLQNAAWVAGVMLAAEAFIGGRSKRGDGVEHGDC